MSSERYVVLGVARARSRWFADVSRWTASGLVAIEFVKTVSLDQVRARLSSGRPFSAVLVDGSMPSLDRDLFDLANERGAVVIVVSDGDSRDWAEIGASAVVSSRLSADDLVAVLAAHSRPIDPLDRVPGSPPPRPAAGFRAQVVAVTGAGGVGSSSIAAAVAQGIAGDPAHSGSTLLADLALDADQGLLHDAGDIYPGVLELAERHRGSDVSLDEVRSVTFDIVARRYRLLLGLRRHRDWTALRSASVRAALDSLRRAFTLVVAEIDDDFEGEAQTGSVDVEDRNQLSRITLSLSDVVVVVGTPGLSGVHGMLRVAKNCVDAGFPASNIVPVLNRVPRRRRAESVAAVNEFLSKLSPEVALLSPIVVPERAEVERSLRDGSALPASIVDPVTRAVRARLETAHATAAPTVEPQPVAVGSLGDWFDGEGAT